MKTLKKIYPIIVLLLVVLLFSGCEVSNSNNNLDSSTSTISPTKIPVEEETVPSKLDTSQNCKIKGNISSSGEKIYHVPGGAYYDKTVINTEAGERWFCSENEAQAAGWRESKR